MKKLLPLLLLTSSTAFAGSFSSVDARSIAMGSTGVAASKPGTASIFNPALLSIYNDGETFSLILADFGGGAVANEDTIDGFSDIADEDYISRLTDSVDSINNAVDNVDVQSFSFATDNFAAITNEFNEKLYDIDGEALSGNGKFLMAIAKPSKDFGIGAHLTAGVSFETGLLIASCDHDLLSAYSNVVGGLDNPQAFRDAATGEGTEVCGNSIFDESGRLTTPEDGLTSAITIASIVQAEAGIAISRQFRIKGHNIAFGVTPKIVTLTTRYIAPTLQDLSSDDYEISDDLEEHETDDSSFDLDIGAAMNLLQDDSLKVGIVIKNLLGTSFDTAAYTTADGTVTGEVNVDTDIRIGASWSKVGFSLAADLDLVESNGFLGDTDTQYLAFGAEYNAFNAVRIRGGLRTNLSDTDDMAITGGIGFNIIAAHGDFGLQYSDFNLSIAFQLGLEF